MRSSRKLLILGLLLAVAAPVLAEIKGYACAATAGDRGFFWNVRVAGVVLPALIV